MTGWLTFFEGALLGAALIIAIGAQNAYVIRQGIRGEHVFPIAAACFVTDAILITIGAAGLGSFIAETPWLRQVAAWGGAVFLIVYGAQAAWRAWRTKAIPLDGEPDEGGTGKLGLKGAVLAALAFSWLNPHVYLDTVVLLGGVAAQVDDDLRPLFTLGAVCASFVWFFGLALGARAAAPFFQGPFGIRVLDAVVAAVMWNIAATLIHGELR